MASPTQPVNSATVARRRPIAGRNSGSGPSFRRGGGSISTIRRNCAGSSCVSRVACRSFSKPSRCAIRAGISASRSFVGVGKQPEQNVAVKPVVAVRAAAFDG